MKLKALLLDLGNVLVFHDNELLFQRMSEAYRITREQMRARLDASVWERVNRGQLPGDALRCELNARLGRQVGEEEFFQLWNCHFTVHQQMVEKVEALEGQYRRVLLSNTHDLHVRYLRPLLPVLERLDGLVLSYEVGLVKPEPAIYARALAAAGVAAHEAVFFDDVAAYVEGAKAQGIEARVFTTAARFESDLAELISRG